MPTRHAVPLEDLQVRAYDLWKNQWLLLTAGELAEGRFNTMTVAWGGLGAMWHKPMAMIVVRPTRHTFQFCEGYDTFTLCAFGEQHRAALKLCGSRSGRDTDKVAATGLHPVASTRIAAPGFDEASLILECRKIYHSDFNPGAFLDPAIEENYPKRDYHRMYFGEILAAFEARG